MHVSSSLSSLYKQGRFYGFRELIAFNNLFLAKTSFFFHPYNSIVHVPRQRQEYKTQCFPIAAIGYLVIVFYIQV
jgi:hypothetical protein